MSDNIVTKYDRIAEGFSERSYANLAFYMHRRFRLATSWVTLLQPGDTVLELGCGDGYLAELFVRHGFAYHGIDISPQMVRIAEQRLQRLGLPSRFTTVDINNLNLEESYDMVLSFMGAFFSYIHDPLKVLKALYPHIRKKILIDINPRGKYQIHTAMDMLRAAGFRHITWRPFFVPKEKRLPHWLLHMLACGEEIPLVRSLPLQWKFHCLLQGQP